MLGKITFVIAFVCGDSVARIVILGLIVLGYTVNDCL
jgi:hypothetical protein